MPTENIVTDSSTTLRKAMWVVIPVVLALTVTACSGASDVVTTTTQPVGPDSNDSRIVTTDWDNKSLFCETAERLASTAPGETVDSADVYAGVYAQVIRELTASGPDDPAFVTTMNTVKWAAETMESSFLAGAPDSVPSGEEFGYFVRQAESVQGGPGVRTATARLNAFLTTVCGFSLGGSAANPNLPSTATTAPSASLKLPTEL